MHIRRCARVLALILLRRGTPQRSAPPTRIVHPFKFWNFKAAATMSTAGSSSSSSKTPGSSACGPSSSSASVGSSSVGASRKHTLDRGNTEEREPEAKTRRTAPSRFAEESYKPASVTCTKGTAGSAVALTTNYVVLRTLPQTVIFQYHVDFDPLVECKRARKKLIREHESVVGKVRAFDGMILYLPKGLPEKTILTSKLPDDTEVKISIRLTGELRSNHPQCLQLINILFKRSLEKLEMKNIGRHYYAPSLCVNVPQHKVDILPGFITSILPYERGVMLSLDVTHKLLRSMTVLETMYQMHSSQSANFRNEVTRKIIGTTVITRYNNKTYRIDDIDWNRNPTDTFETKKGPVSFLEYYDRAYGKKIADPGQPLLVSMPKKRDEKRGFTGPILLIPELCNLTGISDEMKSDFRVMKDLAVHTRPAPAERRRTLQALVDQFNREAGPQEIFSGWNLQFEPSLVELNGRALPPESVHQRGRSYNPDQFGDWSRNLRGAALIAPVELSDWLVVFTRSDGHKANEFVKTLMRVAGPMGINVGRPNMFEIPNDRTESFLMALKQNIHPNLKLAVCLLPRDTKDRYAAIKKFCCIDRPVPSQCIVSRTLNKNLMSVCTKIALQINCKLGGELWAVEIPIRNAMVIGIDLYHDSAQKGRSVVGFVSSINSTLTKYYCQTVFQNPGQDIASGLRQCLKAALKKYGQVNRCLPDRVMVYRDGVGEGQLQEVFEFEVPQFTAAFNDTAPGYEPKFTFIVVTKRINTRFLLRRGGGGGGQYSNPPPGILVDSDVTKPYWYDFFLISQSVRQGTVAPAHFNVIWDTSGLKPDHIQRLSYKLCHLYYNWSGTVRVPAPVQYAHKLAFLIGDCVHKETSPLLADKLFFL